jgi:hypothetical protein
MTEREKKRILAILALRRIIDGTQKREKNADQLF